MYNPAPLTRDIYGTGKRGTDVIVLAIIGFFIYGVVATARLWEGDFHSEVPIYLDLAHLPIYSVYSLMRALIAYGLSLLFTLTLGYAAAKNRLAERIIVPLLDIGQSIPVLGFLPGLVLGLIALFPHSNIGIELACIVMIFTGQVWNMTFSYISSLKSVPEQLHEMADNVGFGKVQKLLRVELPCAATGLAWNSLMSMAGGWFFLTVCESFTLGERNFRLPGLGSYMAVAIEKGDEHAMLLGIGAMITVIVFVDFVVWRPIIAWSSKFRLTEQLGTSQEIPFMTLLLKESVLFQSTVTILKKCFHYFLSKRQAWKQRHLQAAGKPLSLRKQRSRKKRKLLTGEKILFGFGAILACWVLIKIFGIVKPLSFATWREIIWGALFTFLRVVGALIISTLWAVPVGIMIGLNPKVTRLLQPVIQVAASFPAPMLYPLALGIFTFLHLPLSVSSGLLMLLGVQWYVLFNVLAGAIGISGDLRESFRLIGVSRKYLWKNLYLPSVFPNLVTGWVTAAGGAWNASIVAEFISYKGQSLTTWGLGSQISEATSSGNFPKLAACLMLMVVAVVGFNRFVWKHLYRLAEQRYRFER